MQQRIHIAVDPDQPEQKKVYDILQHQQNKSSYIRKAILYYEERETAVQNQGITKEEMEEIIERKNKELLHKLTKLTEQQKAHQPLKQEKTPKQAEEERRAMIDKKYQEGQW